MQRAAGNAAARPQPSTEKRSALLPGHGTGRFTGHDETFHGAYGMGADQAPMNTSPDSHTRGRCGHSASLSGLGPRAGSQGGESP